MKRFNPRAVLCMTTLVLTSTVITSASWAQSKTNGQAASLEDQVVLDEQTPRAPEQPSQPPASSASQNGQPSIPNRIPSLGPRLLDPSRVVFAADSFFAFDRWELRTDNVRTPKHIVTEAERTAVETARHKLDVLAERLKGLDIASVGIHGHTDSDGPESYNQGLSERRAQSIMKYLISRGVPKEKIRAYGEGELKPIADNATREGRAKNRRVEIEINGAMVK